MTDKTEITTMQENDSQAPMVPSSPGAIMFQDGVLERVEKIAGIMAKSRSMVPAHLRGNPGDCMAIVMQAAQWGMDPFSVARKSYQVQSGSPIAYEAQMINAVILQNAPIIGRPKYEFFGDWSKVQGKVEMATSQKGKKYAKAGWKPADELGLGVDISVHIKGEASPTVMRVLLTQCYPRNSTNWVNDPQQQICYAAIQKFSRRHMPDVILGVYSTDEIEIVEKDITPRSTLDDLQPAADSGASFADYLSRIGEASTVAGLQDIGKHLADEPAELRDMIRPAYNDALQALKAAQAEQAPPGDGISDVDVDTGEVIEHSGPEVDAETAKRIIEIADSSDGLDDVVSMIDCMDKRSKEYTDLMDMISIRRSELNDGGN